MARDLGCSSRQRAMGANHAVVAQCCDSSHPSNRFGASASAELGPNEHPVLLASAPRAETHSELRIRSRTEQTAFGLDSKGGDKFLTPAS